MYKEIIGVVVLIIMVATFAIPVVITAGESAAGTATSEQFSGTASTNAVLLHNPVKTVSYFAQSTLARTSNITQLDNANGTQRVTLTTPLRSTTFNLSIWANVTGNVSVTVNGYLLPTNLTGGVGATAYNNIPAVYLTSPTGVMFTTGTAFSNVTNWTVTYYYWNSTSDYAVTNGYLVPTKTGIFLTTYTYGDSTGVISSILRIIPIMFALFALSFIAYRSGVLG